MCIRDRFYPKIVENGISIATPNKKAFSSDLATWKQLFAGKPTDGLVYHEATVGACLLYTSRFNEVL